MYTHTGIHTHVAFQYDNIIDSLNMNQLINLNLEK